MRRLCVLLTVLSGSLFAAGCTSFHALPTTPAGIAEGVAPGDTVRMRVTGEPAELIVRVRSVGRESLRGRVRGGPDAVIGLDSIEGIEIERLNLRKTVLSTVVPVVIGAYAVCRRQDCRTNAVLVARY